LNHVARRTGALDQIAIFLYDRTFDNLVNFAPLLTEEYKSFCEKRALARPVGPRTVPGRARARGCNEHEEGLYLFAGAGGFRYRPSGATRPALR